MGRELKRVPADFDWPLSTTWKGYLNPHSDKWETCAACEGRGESPEVKHLHDLWWGYLDFKPEDRGSTPFQPDDPLIRASIRRKIEYSDTRFYQNQAAFALSLPTNRATLEQAVQVEAVRMCGIYNKAWYHHLNQDDVDALRRANRLWDFTRVPLTAEHRLIVKRRLSSGQCNSWLPFDNGYWPTSVEVNRYSLTSFSGPDEWPPLEAEAKRLGYPIHCSACNGKGGRWPSEEAELADKNWKRSEPPTGEAYQVWETVSEGSPISPPFLHPPALASWMAVRYPTDGTHDQWMKFILGRGWTPSMILDSTGVKTGAAITDLYEDEDVEETKPKLSLVVEAAVLGMAHTRITRKRLRKWVRQERKAAVIEEARRQKEREIERAEAA
jgi:hypothetical protein